MLGLIAAAVSLAVVAANSDVQGCTVSDWTEWSECLTPKSCEDQPDVKSWSVPAATWDSGRVRMKRMMRQKEAHHAYKGQCKADGSCPELMPRNSEGAFKCQNGMAGEVQCRNVDQLSFVNFDDLGYPFPIGGDLNRAGNDIWGWTDPDTGDEYAIMGLTGGTSFVRITDPTNPVTLAFLRTQTLASPWRDMKVIGHYAYIVAEASDHGMQIFDLHRLRSLNDLQMVTADALYTRVGNTHNIVANEETGYVYLVGSDEIFGDFDICDGGLHVVDVRDPLNPRFAGCFGGDGYVHDAQCVVYRGPDVRYNGREICFCYNEDSFTIVDVTNKNAMTMISKKTYDGSQYTHQGWATPDFSTILLDDELDEQRTWWDRRTKTYLWDIRDLTNPVLKSRYDSTERSIDHNQYIVGEYTYQANYEAGLRILHVDVKPSVGQYDLHELAYFDVYPWITSPNFNGAWSVYPYYPSGNMVVSSIDYGLYVVRPDYDAIEAERRSSSYGEKKRTRDLIRDEKCIRCPHLEEIQQCIPDIMC